MEKIKKKTEKNNGNLVAKNPVAVVLGHIDHGKSSLLEAIKKEIKITAKESGGITQHIGAYEVLRPKQEGKEAKKITFIDTPGHEAFSAMRSRGAGVADIAILVVDGSEGVKPQTKEAIRIIKDAKMPMIVALNKIDKPGIQPEWVMGELKGAGVEVEKMGGKIPCVKTSAKTGAGIEELLETIVLISEMEDLKTDLRAPLEAVVIESSLDPQRGPAATLILQKGVLRENDFLGTSSIIGKARQILDFLGKPLREAFPSQPVQIIGFEQAPKMGEKVRAFADYQEAKKSLVLTEKHGLKVSSRIEKKENGQDKKVLNIVLKADFLGSLEAIEDVLKNIPQKEVALRIVGKGVGNIGNQDIQLAESTKARIFGFRVKIDESAKFFSQNKKIIPKTFNVIYELVEEVRSAMENKIVPEKKRIDVGKIKIIALFKQDKKRQIVGGKVVEGEARKDVRIEIFRQEAQIGQGRIKTLEIEKKEIGSAQKGKEVGMNLESSVVVEEGDILVLFREEKEKKTL